MTGFNITLHIGGKRELFVQFIKGFNENREPIPLNLDQATLTFYGIELGQVLFSVAGNILDAVSGKAVFKIPATATSGLGPGIIDGQFKVAIAGDPEGPYRLNGQIRLVGGATP
jgi:hypothetical protein